MPRKGKKTPGISQHTHKTGNKTNVGQRVDLLLHAVFLIQKPPSRPKLDFSLDSSVIEITCHTGYDFIVGWVKVVKYCFCQLI